MAIRCCQNIVNLFDVYLRITAVLLQLHIKRETITWMDEYEYNNEYNLGW